MTPLSLSPWHKKSPARMRMRCLLTVALLSMGLAAAQSPKKLSLAEAEQIALRNHPRIASASLVAQAARSAIAESRAPFYPFVAGNFTSVAADHSTTLAAGAVQTSSLYSRVAAGVTISQ